MPNYRRSFITGGMYFFTVKTEHHTPVFGELSAVRLLGNSFERSSLVRIADPTGLTILRDGRCDSCRGVVCIGVG